MEFPRTGLEEAGGSFVVVIDSMGSTVTSATSPPRHTNCLFGIISVLPIILVVFVGIVEPIDVEHNYDVVLLLQFFPGLSIIRWPHAVLRCRGVKKVFKGNKIINREAGGECRLC